MTTYWVIYRSHRKKYGCSLGPLRADEVKKHTFYYGPLSVVEVNGHAMRLQTEGYEVVAILAQTEMNV